MEFQNFYKCNISLWMCVRCMQQKTCFILYEKALCEWVKVTGNVKCFDCLLTLEKCYTNAVHLPYAQQSPCKHSFKAFGGLQRNFNPPKETLPKTESYYNFHSVIPGRSMGFLFKLKAAARTFIFLNKFPLRFRFIWTTQINRAEQR